MKRIIIALLAAVVLASGIGGAVYASGEHQPMRGDKLVAMGAVGEIAVNDSRFWKVVNTVRFTITNPDCQKSIKIERLQVMDVDGTVVFAGGPGEYEPTPGNTVAIPEELLPHQIWFFGLESITGGLYELATVYTVEIDWKGANPPIGRVAGIIGGITTGGEFWILTSSNKPMVDG